MIPRILLTQKTALLPVQTRPPPDVGPGPLRDELLSWPRERAGVLQRAVDVLIPEDSPAHIQPLFEKLLGEVINFRIRRHGDQYNEGVDKTCVGRSLGFEVKLWLQLTSLMLVIQASDIVVGKGS